MAADLDGVRRSVAGFARTAGLAGDRVDRLVVAVSEVATNAVVHGGGVATVTMTVTMTAAQNGQRVVVTVSDSGHGPLPLVGGQFPPAGSARPDPEQLGGRGLWISRQLCDEVIIDTVPAGTTVKLIMSL